MRNKFWKIQGKEPMTNIYMESSNEESSFSAVRFSNFTIDIVTNERRVSPNKNVTIHSPTKKELWKQI